MILAAVGACSEGTPTEHATVWNGLDEQGIQKAGYLMKQQKLAIRIMLLQ